MQLLTWTLSLVPSTDSTQFLRRVASTPALEESKQKGSKGSSANSHLGAYSPSSPAARSNSTLNSTMTATTATTANYLNARLNGLHLNIPNSPNGSTLDLRRVGNIKRTYSSNSIKKRSIEVTPSSFVKIRLLGKGDVGKVYLVRQKDTERLFAMKGIIPHAGAVASRYFLLLCLSSVEAAFACIR